MADIVFTKSQRQAIETVDRSVLVSAAAGSGKTAVLAARCVHLVCDAEPPDRCDVENLLVVTFTEAAAAEMKTRIHDRLAERSADRPNDRRLRNQLSLIDTAQISTLHSFCLWIIRRWFHRLDIDANSQLLDADEADLLKTETLNVLLDQYYERTDQAGVQFRTLVEEYGLGFDGTIASFISKLAEFLTSVPDQTAWINHARDNSDQRIEEILSARRNSLREELDRQIQYCQDAIQQIETGHRLVDFYATKLNEHLAQMVAWRQRLDDEKTDPILQEIKDHEISASGAPRAGKNDDEADKERRDVAKGFLEKAKKFFESRIRVPHGLFSIAEQIETTKRTLPYIATITDLVTEFQKAYERTKRELAVLDFADLERLAYRLLTRREAEENENPVTAELRQRFRYVMVDEFQDINPLQAAILKLVSTDDLDGNAGNLFAVGDVKQSIYRFRLAEAGQFVQREADLLLPDTDGVCIHLQNNYRSTSTIIQAVNTMFARLMHTDAADLDYDTKAELRPPDDGASDGPPIELHILAKKGRTQTNTSGKDDKNDDTDTNDDATSSALQPRFVDPSDPAQWTSVEREAFLVGRRIQELISEGHTTKDGDSERPLCYKDICILLRSPSNTAESFTNLLASMDIPARADVTGGLFEAREVAEVLALLEVMDNMQQDIPLASVLRSGILEERLSEDELVQIRTHNRSVPFHQTVREFANEAKDEKLKDKLNTVLRRILRYRNEANVRPLADVLWMIYRETGYFAYVSGLRHGQQRRANLLALHERARQFGHFQRQGLRRFLQFIENLRKEDNDLGTPSTLSESEDVVRIMSIHKSKGLEFPVVFVAELGKQFNLTDKTGRMILDRQVGIGLKAVERDRLIEYPTPLYRWCSESIEQASRAEELRVLYVAVTRARERLILVGTHSLNSVEELRNPGNLGNRIPPLTVRTANNPLDWVIPGIGPVRVADPLFESQTYDEDAIASWSTTAAPDDESAPLRQAVAALAPLPKDEPTDGDQQIDQTTSRIIDQLDYTYPNLGVSSVRAAWAASEVKRPYSMHDATTVTEESAILLPDAGAPKRSNAPVQRGHRFSKPTSPELDAPTRGRVTHKALQFIDVARTADAQAVRDELDRLVAAGTLTTEEARTVDVDALVWFFGTDLGHKIQEAGDTYRREWMFISSEEVATFDPTVAGGPDDSVLVRGVADGLLMTDDGLEVLDFKTDRVPAEHAQQRAQYYSMQLRLYASAAEQVFGKKVTRRHLVFLHCRTIVELDEDTP